MSEIKGNKFSNMGEENLKEEFNSSLREFIEELKSNLVTLEEQLNDEDVVDVYLDPSDLYWNLINVMNMASKFIVIDEAMVISVSLEYRDELYHLIENLDNLVFIINQEKSHKLISYKCSKYFKVWLGIKDNIVKLIPREYHEQFLNRVNKIKGISDGSLTDDEILVVERILFDLQNRYGESNIELQGLSEGEMSVKIKNIDTGDDRRRF